MTFLGWLLRILLLLFVIRLIVRFVTGRRRAAAGGGRPRRVERLGGALVRDPQCGTYIPQAGAIRLGSGGDARYFCSDDCRAAWVAAHR